MSARDEEHIADLLASLPPAPGSWVAAAHEIPRTERELADVMRRIEADEEFRRAVEADIAAALERFGYAADPGAVQAVRRRLSES
jgi:chemotaxis regulatin CheY-phosphate phosphatase CheZ